MMAKCADDRTRFAAPSQPLSRGKAPLTGLAIAAVFVGIFALELVAVGASLPSMLPQDPGSSLHGTR